MIDPDKFGGLGVTLAHLPCFGKPGKKFKTALREIAKVHEGDYRLTVNQCVIVSDVADEELPQLERLPAEFKSDGLDHSGLRPSSLACVAFPKCGTFYPPPALYENDIGVRCIAMAEFEPPAHDEWEI